MAQQTKLAQVLNGLTQNIDLTGDELVLDAVRLGGLSGTLLDQTSLDSLLADQHSPGSDNQNITAGSGLSGGGSGATPTLDVNVDDSTIEINSDILRVKDAGITAAKLAGAISAQTFDATNTATNYSPMQVSAEGNGKISAHLNGINAELGNKISSAEKGSNNGVATLDGGGKIPASQLPNSVMEYQGNWDASTNTPTLADGTGSAGDVYRASVAGTQDLGSGPLTFNVGDWAVYNGTIWEHSTNSDSVVSVNGQSGVVVLAAGDIAYDNATSGMAAGDVQQAIDELDGRVDTVESSLNSHLDGGNDKHIASSITYERADIDRKNIQPVAITDNVEEALADLDDAIGALDQTPTNYTAANPAIVADHLSGIDTELGLLDGRVTTLEAGAGSAQSVKMTMVAGESYAANTTFIVRFAVNGETAGRVYKAAPANALTDKKYWAIGTVSPTGAVTAGQNIVVTLQGAQPLGTSDTPFSASDLSQPVWLTAAGSFSTTAPTASGSAAYLIGKVNTTTSIFVDAKQLTGIN